MSSVGVKHSVAVLRRCEYSNYCKWWQPKCCINLPSGQAM